MKYIIAFLFIQFFFVTFSQRFETVSPGYWSDSSIWLNHIVPGDSISDTLVVNHHVIFESSKSCYSYVLINNRGAICGHYDMTIYHKMDVYGFIKIDTFNIYGGKVMMICSQKSIFNGPIRIRELGASFINNGGYGFSVTSEQFNCEEGFLTSDIDEIKGAKKMMVYPNPASNYLKIDGNLENLEIKISDLFGKIYLQQKATSEINLEKLQNGIYLVHFFKNGILQATEKIIVQK